MIDCIWYSSIGFFFLVTAPVDDSFSIWAQWGLAGAVVGITLWRDWEREKRMSAEIGKLTEQMNKAFMGALEKNTLALEELKRRPCMIGDK